MPVLLAPLIAAVASLSEAAKPRICGPAVGQRRIAVGYRMRLDLERLRQSNPTQRKPARKMAKRQIAAMMKKKGMTLTLSRVQSLPPLVAFIRYISQLD